MPCPRPLMHAQQERPRRSPQRLALTSVYRWTRWTVGLLHFDEVFHARQVAHVLRRRLDGRRRAALEFGMHLVGALCPDHAAAALGEFLEVAAAAFDRAGDGLVLHEQALER